VSLTLSELVVNLADEASVELAWQILKLVRTDHTVSAADRASPELPPWEADTPAATQAVASAESAAETSEPDPWAVSAQNQQTPAAATTAPSTDADEDDPWS
jgi:hypothetical protein